MILLGFKNRNELSIQKKELDPMDILKGTLF